MTKGFQKFIAVAQEAFDQAYPHAAAKISVFEAGNCPAQAKTRVARFEARMVLRYQMPANLVALHVDDAVMEHIPTTPRLD